MEALRQLLKDKLPDREFARFETIDYENLLLKRFKDEDALNEATEHMLQGPPGDPLPALLIKSLLQAFHPEALLQTGASQPDTTLAYLRSVMPDRDMHPPSYAELPDALPLLPHPLPLIQHHVQRISDTFQGAEQLPLLAVSTVQQPASLLGSTVSYALTTSLGSGEHTANGVVLPMVNGLMENILTTLGIHFRPAGNVADPSGATAAALRPDLMLYISNVLMFKVETKIDPLQYTEAKNELLWKMADWRPALHGAREYMLCCAVAGHRLGFYAVTRGGAQSKPVSPEFDLRSDLDRLKVMHTSTRALTIILQQVRHQLPCDSLPLGLSLRYNHSVIMYTADRAVKEVDWRTFENADEQVLKKVYKQLLQLSNGAGLNRPRGLNRPLKMPELTARNNWQVELPLGWPRAPTSLPLLRRLVADVLHGLAILHERGIVHRDVRLPNILQMPDEGQCGYALIDYEHSGMVGDVPPFPPLRHWPAECRQHGAPYTTAADIYSVGKLMRHSGIPLDAGADDFSQLLTAEDPAQRPSTSATLSHPWLAGA